ncbi:dihydrodipicolinate synthase family protein [Shewanella electrodiphila]|uniref:Dihydrodipicolinate synthase family protein n=1 Tax=Shewanella electrodiphila TaxID=934143 RepID=A0ABT0KNW4_9GAMM|nr:dihydrodipicolinate synthase family protein [Shewanella electrodiphila]MCL1045535.1 dihydrodipicolinate synthase family protein [Shewanella electrodiphila]
MKVNCQGVFPAISTQFNDDDSINDESNARMSEDLIKNGIDGIIALVTMGENPSLSPQENRKFIKHTVETVNGRILVLSGFTENTAEFESQYAKDIEQLGVEDIALENLLLKATGWISGRENVFPRESITLLKLARARRIEQARKIYHWFIPQLLLDIIQTLVQCVKFAEQLFGRGSENVRLPRMSLTGNERAYV